MAEQMMVIVEAERVWWQQHASGQGPDVDGTWKHVRETFTGRVVDTPPQDTRVKFNRMRRAVEGEDQNGLLALGPPTQLPSGRYRVTWWLAGDLQRARPDDVLVTCAIEVRRQKHAVESVPGSAFVAHAGKPFGVTIETSIDANDRDIGFVTWWQGRGRVTFLRMECSLVR